MKILVCVKQLPDHRGVRRFDDQGLVDRASATGMLGELDEYALEQAERLRLHHGGEVIAVCVGSAGAEVAVRRALHLGADRGYLVSDEAVRGSDANRMSLVLAAAVRAVTAREGTFDLVLCGMSSTDSYMGTMPAMLAERLGLPHATFATRITLDPQAEQARVHIERTVDGPTVEVTTTLPALISVTDQSVAPRLVTFRHIARAQDRPVVRIGLDELGLRPDQIGVGAARARIVDAVPVDRQRAGQIVVDDGEGSGARALADFLLTHVPQAGGPR